MKFYPIKFPFLIATSITFFFAFIPTPPPESTLYINGTWPWGSPILKFVLLFLFTLIIVWLLASIHRTLAQQKQENL
ncbi:hypothetical protein KKA53_03120 [Candidatus Dependentiae bacterium]|nr:hypothetical protein [Candidatus Dependentiae bacterium]